VRKAIFLAITCFLLAPAVAVAQIPQTMSYQGMLRDDATQGPIGDGNYSITFRLYSAPSGGSAIWSETQSVPVEGGLFSVILGSSNPLTLPFDDQYWITIQLSGQPETTPRAALTSVPYALRALTADVGDDGDWTIDGNNIYRINGRVGIGTNPSAAFPEEPRGDDLPRTLDDAKLVVGHSLNAVYARLYETNDDADGRAALYGYRGRSVRNDGTDYTPTETNNAITGLNYYGDSFTFGVAGFTYSDFTENGGVLGAERWGNYWGALGYKDADSGQWGVYTPNNSYVGGTVDVGDFRMTDGAVDGYVLTSTASGLASWQPPAGGGFSLPYSGTGDSGSVLFQINQNGIGDVVGFHNNDPAAGLASIYTTHEGPGRTIEANMVGTGQAALFDIFNTDNSAPVIDAETNGTGPAIVGETNGGVAARFESDGADGPIHVIEGIYTGTTNVPSIGVFGLSAPADGWGTGGWFQGGRIGCRGIVTPSGGSEYVGVIGGINGGVGTNYGVYGYAVGSGTNYAGYFDGDVDVTGSLSKGGGSFKIDHPLDPENKYLYHSFVESPDMMNVYNGNVDLDSAGEAWVEMPEWFDTLNRDFRYQLTPIGAPGPNLYIAEQMQDNRFQIAGGSAGMTVSWLVTGVRQDRWAEANRIPVEERKSDRERGHYLHPTAHGQPESRGLNYENNKRATQGSEPAPVNKLDREQLRQQRADNQH